VEAGGRVCERAGCQGEAHERRSELSALTRSVWP
jgi:hypothetical protein